MPGAFERVVRDVVYCVRPASDFIGSENVIAMPKLSALANETDGRCCQVAVVVNVVVEWSARTLFARSLTPNKADNNKIVYGSGKKKGR